MKNDAFEKWMAFILIRGSDQKKYGTLLKGFLSQFDLGNDQYPNTIATEAYVLSNYRLDPKFYENNIDKRSCKKVRNDTEEYKHNTTRFARKDATCYIF